MPERIFYLSRKNLAEKNLGNTCCHKRRNPWMDSTQQSISRTIILTPHRHVRTANTHSTRFWNAHHSFTAQRSCHQPFSTANTTDYCRRKLFSSTPHVTAKHKPKPCSIRSTTSCTKTRTLSPITWCHKQRRSYSISWRSILLRKGTQWSHGNHCRKHRSYPASCSISWRSALDKHRNFSTSQRVGLASHNSTTRKNILSHAVFEHTFADFRNYNLAYGLDWSCHLSYCRRNRHALSEHTREPQTLHERTHCASDRILEVVRKI